MKRLFVLCLALLAIAGVVVTGQGQKAQAEKQSLIPDTPAWRELRTLVGKWEGVMETGGQTMPAQAEVRMTGGGSALMHVLDPGGPYEMITMFHPDGKRILATHYCAAHNQPRMALTNTSATKKLAFDFVDGTNIASGDTYMKSVAITLVDADHHEEAWSNSMGGGAAIFKFTRKK